MEHDAAIARSSANMQDRTSKQAVRRLLYYGSIHHKLVQLVAAASFFFFTFV
jgi:hypothetical protein